jgi:group I intron endonuclease
MTVGIYKFTNTVNGKVYIGQSKDIRARLYTHKCVVKSAQTFLAAAMRKHGFDNFSSEIIEECQVSELNQKEIYWINFYNSTDPEIGYNETKGGHDRAYSSEVTPELLENVMQDLSENLLSMKKIADKYKMSEDWVCNVNTGRRWQVDDVDYPIRKSRVESNKKRPSKEDLIKIIDEFGFNDAAPYCDVSYKTIVNWCERYELPNGQKKWNNWIDR